jgi:hypothetical protein
MHSQRLDLEIFGTQAGVYYLIKAKPKFVSIWTVTYKNFDALEQSSTQFDVGSNFFYRRTSCQNNGNILLDPFTLSNKPLRIIRDFVVQLQIYL